MATTIAFLYIKLSRHFTYIYIDTYIHKSERCTDSETYMGNEVRDHSMKHFGILQPIQHNFTHNGSQDKVSEEHVRIQ